MRRFSQRNSLVTLSDINITPLLDLAFVLLIIFVITTPLLEKGLPLQLPGGGSNDKTQLTRKDLRLVEVTQQGTFFLEHRQMKPDEIARNLEQQFRANPNLVVDIRADENGKYKHVAEVLNLLEQAGITRISLRTDPQH